MKEEIRETKKIRSDIYIKKNHALTFSEDQIINSRYRIIEKIGSGGFGSVFRATDILLKKDVALKFLDPGIRENHKKFIRVQREINISQKISDERIVKIFGIDFMDNTPFLIMEFIEGTNLKTFIKKNRLLKWIDFKSFYIEILNGIKSLHDNNIIHRDIKPSNIIITSAGKIKIIDFGLSKELDDTEKTSSVGEMIGSPKYMSPEQIKGVKLDQTSDIYQLGLILYYILNPVNEGEHDSSTIEQLMKRINSDPRKMYKFISPVSRFLKSGIYKAIETEKDFRFQSIDEMINFFNFEKITLLNTISNFIRRKKSFVSVLISLILLLSLSAIFYFKNSDIISDINFNGSEIIASNSFGSELYKKNFAPMSVLNALPMEIDGDFRRLRLRVDKKSYLNSKEKIGVVFLTKKNLYKDIVKLSIKSENFSSSVALVNNMGKILHHQNFHLENNQMKKSLFSGWMDFNDIKCQDLNADKKNEIIFTTFQNMSMYPSELCILNNKDFHILQSPGHIEHYYFYNDISNDPRVLFTGMNNPFCHLKFICDTNVNNINSIHLPPSLLENIVLGIPKFSYMLIPHKTEILENRWVEQGIISFKSQIDGRVFKLNKEWELSITDATGTRTYKDKPQKISDMIYFLNRAYQKKIEKRSSNNPFYEISKALKLNISNPIFLALTNYLAGDLYLSSGYYSKAEEYFNISNSFLSNNIDLNQKISELYFLSGQKKKLQREIEKNSFDRSKFFGLGNFGIKLFKVYVYLNSGDFRSATDLSGDYSKATDYIKGMISIFKGDYKNSLNETSRLIGRRSTPFTLSEARLLFSRSVLLNYIFNNNSSLIKHEDVKLADFYFSDIAVNSILDGHLAAMSRAYFMALKGDLLNSEKYADETLKKLLQDSKGDMFTKLWLFYDSFIYSKIMEITGNIRKELKGYKISYESNPYSDLGVKSKAMISRLKRKKL